jgi:cyanate permease
MMVTAIGGGLAPWLSGLMRDATGDYQLSLTCAAAAFGAAVVSGWLLPKQGHLPDLEPDLQRDPAPDAAAA